MPAAGSFGVIRMNRPVLEGRDRVFNEARFVQRVRVNRDLNVEFFGDAQTLVDRSGSRSPILLSLRPRAPARICSRSDSGSDECPFPRNPKLSGNASAASYIRRMFQAPGVQVVAFVPVAGPVPPPINVVTPE